MGKRGKDEHGKKKKKRNIIALAGDQSKRRKIEFETLEESRRNYLTLFSKKA